MRPLSYSLPTILSATFLVVACAQPPGPAASQPTVVVQPAPAASPALSTSSVPAEAPRKACIPAHLRGGWVSDLWVDNASPAFCLAASEQDQACRVLRRDALGTIAPRGRPAPWPRTSASGSHTVASEVASVKVCAAPSGACSTISPKGFRGADQSEFPSEVAEHIPADVSPDGSRLMLVRHEGKRSEKVFVETYDLRGARRVGRFPVEVDQFVSRIEWIGRLALLTVCVEEGPGCSARLIDPDTGKTTPVGGDSSINVYGVEHPAHRASGDSWTIVETQGSTVLFINASTGTVEAAVRTGLAADVESGVEVARIDSDRIAMVAGAPHAGDVVVIDLLGRKVASRFSAPVCPE